MAASGQGSRHDSPKTHPYLQQSETSSKTSKTSKFRFPVASSLTLFASLSWNIFSHSHISLILLFGFAIWIKDRRAWEKYTLAAGPQMERVTSEFSWLWLRRRARQPSVIQPAADFYKAIRNLIALNLLLLL